MDRLGMEEIATDIEWRLGNAESTLQDALGEILNAITALETYREYVNDFYYEKEEEERT